MQTVFPFKLFPYPMDWTEDLHVIFFCIALAFAKTSAKTNWSIQTSKIRCGKWSRWTRKAHRPCHSTCLLPVRILLSKRTSRLYESLLKLLGGRFASAKRFCCFEGLNPLRNRSFGWNFGMSRDTAPTMKTLISPKLPQNKFSGFSGCNRRVRN